MPLAANTFSNVVLSDTHHKTVVKLFFFLNSGTTEQGDVLAVNASALVGVTMDLALPGGGLGQQGFLPGEVVTANGGTNAIGNVVAYNPGLNSLRVVLANAAIVFAAADPLVGSRSGARVGVISAARPWYKLSIESIWYDIPTQNNQTVGIGFAAAAGGGAALDSILLHGQGYFGKNSGLSMTIPNPKANSGDPNIYVSTYNFDALNSYTVILELKKSDGYGRPVEG
jgi:hypothetical protein